MERKNRMQGCRRLCGDRWGCVVDVERTENLGSDLPVNGGKARGCERKYVFIQSLSLITRTSSHEAAS